MNDKNDFDALSDDEDYDDALDENFEFDDEDYDDLDLESELGDDWDEEDEGESNPNSDSDSHLQSKPKFRLDFNTIVILGAVALGALVMISQVGKEKAALQVENPPETIIPTALRMEGAFKGPGAIENKTEKSDSETAELQKESDEQKEGFLFDVDILDNSKDIVHDTPPMPSPIASEQQDGTIEEQKTADLNGISEDVKNDVAFKEELEEKPQIPNAPDDIKTILDQEEVALNGPLEVEKETVDESIENQPILKEVEQKDISQKTILESGQPDSLDQKLDNILTRLESMESKISEIEGMAANRESLKQKEVVLEKSKPSVEKKIKEASVPVKTPPVKKIVKKQATKKVVKKVSWELRAAQPGKAWVSRKGQKNMQPVVVGDKLTGIGRIQSINHFNGRWVVRGSAGKITQ